MSSYKSPPIHTFKECVELLKKRAETEVITIEKLFETFSGKGYPLVIMCLSIPFCIPLQIPGFSTPFGILIAILGLRLLFGHAILLPKKVLSKPLSKESVHKIIDTAVWMVEKVRRFSKIRLIWFSTNPIFYAINGFLTVLMGLLLALPLPIPLTNIISAWALLLLHFGLLEDDGLFILVGYILSLICIGFFAGIFIVIVQNTT